MQLEISITKVKRALFSTIGVLIFAYVSLQLVRFFTHKYLFGIIDQFDVDRDQGIPAWFSQTQLFVAAILLGIIAVHKRSSRDAFARHWTWLAIIFFYLSADEGASLHEMWVYPMQRAFKTLPDFLVFAWVLPFTVFTLVIFGAYLKFLKALSPSERRGFLIAGSMYVGGALVMEMIGSKILHSGLLRRYYLMSITVEESLEMFGIALFVVMLLAYIKQHIPEFSVKVIE